MIKHLWRNLKVNVACMKREASGRAELRKIGSFGMGFAPLAAAHDRRNFANDYAKKRDCQAETTVIGSRVKPIEDKQQRR